MAKQAKKAQTKRATATSRGRGGGAGGGGGGGQMSTLSTQQKRELRQHLSNSTKLGKAFTEWQSGHKALEGLARQHGVEAPAGRGGKRTQAKATTRTTKARTGRRTGTQTETAATA